MNIRCNNCGNTKFSEKFVDEVFNVNDRIFVVKNIKAYVCDICDEKYFTPETQRNTLELINNKNNIRNRIEAEVFDFA
jgi:YgiT-type zinc finger domain-containing protein